MASPLRSPFKVNTDSNQGIITISPMKMDYAAIFSPFKDSSLSPFKLLQSPSKGTFDEWDKDLFANLDENLFDIDDLSVNMVDELLKSPQGKALFKNSPDSVARRLRISPANRNKAQRFQSLNNTDDFNIDCVVKTEPFEFTTMKVKEEDTVHDHMYGQRDLNMEVDLNKMSDTPMKPRLSNIENAPIRKLSMRPISVSSSEAPTVAVLHSDLSVQHLPQHWPSKERLQFARMQFRDVLNRAVEREIEIRKRASMPLSETQPTVGKKKATKHHSGKNGKGCKVSGKGKKVKSYKKRKKNMYAEGRPVLTKSGMRSYPPVVHSGSGLAPRIQTHEDPAWDLSEEEEVTWSGPPPFVTQTSSGFYTDESSEEDSEEEETQLFKYETLSGRRVTLKKPKLW